MAQPEWWISVSCRASSASFCSNSPAVTARGRGQHHCVELLGMRRRRVGRRGSHAELPTIAGGLQGLHVGAQTDAVCGQSLGNRLDQTGDPVARSHEHAVASTAAVTFRLRCTLGLPHHSSNQAAMLLLHIPKSRHGRQQTQLLRVARVNAADQRLHQPIVRLTSKATGHEGGQALVTIVLALRYKELGRHPQLGQRSEDGRRDHRPDAAGGHNDEPLGNPPQLPPTDHKGTSMLIVRLHQLVGKPDASTEVHGPRHVGNEVVRAPFEQEPVLAVRLQHATQLIPPLEQRDRSFRRQFCQTMCGGQPRDAATDNCHFLHQHHARNLHRSARQGRVIRP